MHDRGDVMDIGLPASHPFQHTIKYIGLRMLGIHTFG